jgi:hypothetical protein
MLAGAKKKRPKALVVSSMAEQAKKRLMALNTRHPLLAVVISWSQRS